MTERGTSSEVRKKIQRNISAEIGGRWGEKLKRTIMFYIIKWEKGVGKLLRGKGQRREGRVEKRKEGKSDNIPKGQSIKKKDF